MKLFGDGTYHFLLLNEPQTRWRLQYIPRNMHTDFALLCFVVVIHWLIFPYPSGLLHWHCGNLTIAPVPAKQPWWIWINTLCEFIMNDCINTTKQSTKKPCAYFLGYTVGTHAKLGRAPWCHSDEWRLVSWASYQIRKIAGCACAGNAGNVFPHRRFKRKPLVSDPGMHHGTCVTHVPWCMSGSLTCGDGGKRSRHSRRMRTSNFAYLARGPWSRAITLDLLLHYWNDFIYHAYDHNYLHTNLTLRKIVSL